MNNDMVIKTKKNRLSYFIALIFIFASILFSAEISFSSDDFSIDIPDEVKNGKIESVITKLIDKFSAGGLTEAKKFAAERGILLKNNMVKVVLMIEKGKKIKNGALTGFGIEIDKTSKNLKRAYVPMNLLNAIEKKFPGIIRIRLPFKPEELAVTHSSEGVSLTNASAWHTEGYKGAGKKIAIIDLGFDNLTETIANGDLPATVITNDYTGSGLETGTVHGTAVAEAVHDMAPDAQLYLLKIGDEIDLANAEDDCKNLYSVNVINHSVGWTNTGPYNGTGVVCDIADDARANGILWVNSIGNHANNHYEGVFADTDGDNWHEYSSSPIDEINWVSASAGQYISAYLTWDDWCPDPNNPASCQDYDLYLIDSGLNIVAGSGNLQDCTAGQSPTEAIEYYVTTSGSYGILIKKYSTTRDCDLKLLVWRQALESGNRTVSGSFIAPADAAGVMAVGAINSASWTTGPQESFSSRGPTTNWCGATPRIKPDIAGPDNIDSFTYGHWFGTSASSPHVAGAAALVWQKFPYFDVNQVQAYLEGNAVDMGAVGKDNIYGSGRLNLPSGPTLISLSSFSASGLNGKAVIRWATESEIDNLGFNILRSESENGDYKIINKKFIIGKGTGIKGAAYRFNDKRVKRGRIYWYKLEDIDMNGVSSFNGPVSTGIMSKKKKK